MAQPINVAVDTYVRLWSEPDPAVRARMIEACFAENGRIVTRSRQIRGRSALADEVTRFRADPQWARIRLTSAIDAQGTTFRLSAVAERHDGTTVENFDAGEVDLDGRISLILTFVGALVPAPERR